MAVQIVQGKKKESFGNQIMQGFANIGNEQNRLYQEEKGRENINKFGRQYDIEDLGSIPPELQKVAFQNAIQQKSKTRENETNLDMQNENYNEVKNTFGEKFANVWKAAPVGGKTELLKHGLDALERGEDLQEMLSSVEAPQLKQQTKSLENVPQIENGKFPSTMEWPDYEKRPKGYTPKTWADQKKEWRKENLPVYEANNVKFDNIQADQLATKKLDKLNKSKKMPEGLGKFIINPESGEPYGLAQLSGMVSPEVQEWVKTIARFQNRAKDSFGSRVTNFDLISYMKQFPTLLNTEEGRSRILDMMKINYDLDFQYTSAVKSIYAKYGLNGIPPEEADDLARKAIKDKTEELKIKYLGMNALNEEETNQEKGLSGKMIDVMGPDGQVYEIDESEVEQLPQGFRIQ